jgi:hypothetical protein
VKATRAQLEAAVRDLLSRGWQHNAVASDHVNPACFYCGEKVYNGERHRKVLIPDATSRSGYREAMCPLVTVREALT